MDRNGPRIAGITDILDGYRARKLNVTSAFGRIVDPFVDKVLVVGAFAMLAGPNFAGPIQPLAVSQGLLSHLLPPHRVDDPLAIVHTDDRVDSGRVLEDPFSVAIDQTPGDDDSLRPPRRLMRQRLADHAQRFFPRRPEEPAGVHHDHVGVFHRRADHELPPRQQAKHLLGVHEVLGTAQGNQGDFGLLAIGHGDHDTPPGGNRKDSP
ncbi:MAG: CDP-alcohol phosphatidyltransferase family protein [Planctomycetota bacterium]|nr:CDP-alcohol phosphatidyltransferase family protein [Planctomycetota bacterium]